MVRLAAIELRAYLSEQPARWERVALIPFGPGGSLLGFEPAHESPTTEPSSFAIGSDGSIWILDVGKSRIAHYSAVGRFLGAIEGLSPHARDIAFVGTEMWVIDREQGFLAAVSASGVFTEVAFAEGDHVVHLLQLIPDETGVVAHVDAEPYGELTGFGTERFGAMQTSGGGRVVLLPGIPVGGGRWIRVTDQGLADPHELDVGYVSADLEQVQPFLVHLFTGGAPAGRRVPSVSGPVEFVRAGEDVYITVAAAPDRPRDARLGGGRWLLRVGTGASPLVWERLPQPGVDDAEQLRHVAVGPGGTLYLMILTKGGAQILRRGS